MLPDKDTAHLALDFIVAAASVAWIFIGLLIKNSQANLKADFNAKHAENAQSIAVHLAQDEEKFDAIDKSLNRVESKLDKIANGYGKH